MKNLPKPIKFTKEEGGDWFEWEPIERMPGTGGRTAHAIMFDDGSVLDLLNGWRPWLYCPCCGNRKMDKA